MSAQTSDNSEHQATNTSLPDELPANLWEQLSSDGEWSEVARTLFMNKGRATNHIEAQGVTPTITSSSALGRSSQLDGINALK